MRRGEVGAMRRDAKSVSGPQVEADGEPNRAPTRSKPGPGLHLVATPIGNLGDIGARALATLAGADLVACEDTRVTGKLLALLGLRAPLTPYHEHNAERARPALLARLRQGACVALTSDAGTPLLSDPGFRLVRACLAEGIPVTSVPGPSALLPALQLSGLPCDRFLFAGLPAKRGARRAALAELAGVPSTLVFYEGAPRLAASLADMREVLGARAACVARELTKMHEEVRRAPLADLAAHYAAAGPPKGEVTVVVGPPPAQAAPTDVELDALLREALTTLSVREAAARVAASTGLARRTLYARAVTLRKAHSEDPGS
jgi:16S rRNA (cytidine1402-2'-O)-methyltransferase